MDPSALSVRHWPGQDEHVVFNAASGDLHLLNSAAAAVLGRLIAGPASHAELGTAISTLDPRALGDVLESLDRLGLICPLPP